MDKEKRVGHLHPLTQVIYEICEIFRQIGFVVAEGPEIETEHYNFDVLNIPASHPARDMWDTFWLKPDLSGKRKLLRTHTSPVQVRYMEQHAPPLKIVVPGKTFRYEATDATHEAQFHQIEGLMVNKHVSVADLKGTLEYFLGQLFKQDIKTRLRPSFFPFVEPGFEVDMSCFKCLPRQSSIGVKGGGTRGKSETGNICSVCRGAGWVEIMGAGLVHPNVFKSVGLDPKKWTGFAFGCGADRIAMLKYQIDDIRAFYAGDYRFINQF